MTVSNKSPNISKQLPITPSPRLPVTPSPRHPVTPSPSSLHLISHGSPGTIYLGNSTLELNNLEQYRHHLQQWAIADLYIYGCSVAKGDVGTEFITKLHQLTGANIAAATNKIGNAKLGGNWNLTHTTGQIKNSTVLTPEVMRDYSFVLGQLVNETFTGADVTGNWIYAESGGINVGLTASGGDGTPLRNLNLDTAGNGALRLTTATNSLGGFIFYNSPIYSTDGVKVSFDFFAYNGSGACESFSLESGNDARKDG